MVSVDVKQYWAELFQPELRSCVKVEVAVLVSPSLIVFMVCGSKATLNLNCFPDVYRSLSRSTFQSSTLDLTIIYFEVSIPLSTCLAHF